MNFFEHSIRRSVSTIAEPRAHTKKNYTKEENGKASVLSTLPPHPQED
jgi:hypothetical protein